MKVLAASDIHGSHAVYAWLVRKARDSRADLLVLAGDLLGCPEGFDTVEEAQRADAVAIVRILQGMRLPIYYIMGNDDLVDLDPRSDQFTPIHGRRVELSGANLVGYQFSLPFVGGPCEKPETEIRSDLARLAPILDPDTLLVTHSPAFGVLDLGLFDSHAGSQAILDLVRDRQVRAHVHGHVHEQFGRQDRHFNVASGGRRRAMLIDLETLVANVEDGQAGPE